MKKKLSNEELENLIRLDSEEAPDLSDLILAKAEEEGLFEKNKSRSRERQDNKTSAKKSGGFFDFFKKPLGALSSALAVLVILCAVIIPLALNGGVNAPQKEEDFTSVCIKINPSVEMIVKNGAVTEVKALNKDGAVLLVDADLVGKTVEDACLAVADMAGARQLITDQGITLFVSGKDEKAVEARISNLLRGRNYSLKKGGERYGEEISRLVKRYKISEGKARIIAEILAIFPSYDEKALVNEPSDELYEILEDYKEGEMEDFKAHLRAEYQEGFKAYVDEVKGLLSEYLTDLEAINSTLPENRGKMVKNFNEKYFKLGEDFLIVDHERNWEEVYWDCREEIEEVREDFEEDERETFKDLFEDFMEDFQKDRFERYD